MIPTVPIDAILTSTLGAAFYVAAKKHIRADKPLIGSPYFLWGMAYAILVGMGIALSAYLVNPDWMWMYWVDASRLSTGFEIYVFCMYPAMYTLGFLLSDQVEKLRQGASAKFLAALLTALVVFILVTLGRLLAVGTYSQWQEGTCVPIMGASLGSITTLAWVLLVGLAVALGLGAWLLVRFARGGLRA